MAALNRLMTALAPLEGQDREDVLNLVGRRLLPVLGRNEIPVTA